MTDKNKKKFLSFNIKKANSPISGDESQYPTTPQPQTPNGTKGYSPNATRGMLPPVLRNQLVISEARPRKLSAGSIKDLVQCHLCLEALHNPKMLPCQHTFCMACLTVYIGDQSVIDCPTCETRINVTATNYVKSLPSNLYIDSLLNLVGISNIDKPDTTKTPPSTPAIGNQVGQSVDLFAGGIICSQCKTMCDNCDVQACQHCKMNFCNICWTQHLDDMRTQIGSILKELDSAAVRLGHKMEYFEDRCQRISKQIEMAAEEKMAAIIQSKMILLKQSEDLHKSSSITAVALKNSLEEAKSVATKELNKKDETADDRNVTTFMNLHHNALQLLSEVSKWDTDRFVFDKQNFSLETDASTPCEAESDEPLVIGGKSDNPLENEESLVLHYRSRNFTPHYIWRKTSRPCGVAVSPWCGRLYICGADSHGLQVVERGQARTVSRLIAADMLCPVHLAFLTSTQEIYIADKWKHCVHVFSKDGVHLRSFGQKGSRPGMLRSPEGIATDNAEKLIYVVDTGNDRVQIFQPDGKFVDQLGIVSKSQATRSASVWETIEVTCTELNAPTCVAITHDRIVILDSGNRRVKVYNKQDKGKILEFGSLGQRKGQFRQPEVLAIDPMGFILVGDSGNCRVQVFKPNGQLVRVFGGMGTEVGKFGWISGIHVTKQLDIIISDTKNHCVYFF